MSKQYNNREVYYVGDEVRDILAARDAGVISVAVTSGMGAIDDLLGVKPDYLFSSISSVPTIA